MSSRDDLSVVAVSPVAEAGGAESLLVDVLAGLSKRGVGVRLVALGEGPLAQLARSRGVQVVAGPALSFRHPRSIVACAAVVRRVTAAARPDVVFASHPKGQVIAHLACVGESVTHVTQVYDPPSRRSVSTWLAARLPGLRLAITEETAASYRVLNRRLSPVVIPPGIDGRRLRHEAESGDPDAAWSQAGLGGPGPRIVMVGRLQRFKGHFDFLSAAALVVRERPDARFLIVGPDSPIEKGLRKELQSTIEARGLCGSVALSGRLSGADLAATVSNATLLVHPAHREPFGLAVVEALALGTPVVAYATNGPTKILAFGGGALVPPQDVPGLAAAVLRSINDPSTMGRWAAEAQDVALRFDVSVSVGRYLDELRAACRRPMDVVTMVGVSPPGASGVRDYGLQLSDELRRRGLAVEERWLENSGDRLSEALRVSAQLLCMALRLETRGALIWHYSPVVYGIRGLPAPGVLLGLIVRLRGGHVVSVVHELSYTYRPNVDPPRARVKALVQQLALRAVIYGSTDVVVTTERRRASLETRAVGRSRRVHVIPVFPTIPYVSAPPEGDTCAAFVIGVPAYAGDGVRPDILLDALSKLEWAETCRILLLGAPGADSVDGRRWLHLAAEHGMQDSVQFTGVVDAAEFSRHLQACDVVALVNEEGPSSRKTSLAVSLAHGRPVVSLDGYNRWDELVEAGAVRLVVDAAALGATLAALRDSPAERVALANRGMEFATERMNLRCMADAFMAVLREERRS